MTCRTHSLYVWHWLARDCRDVLRTLGEAQAP